MQRCWVSARVRDGPFRFGADEDGHDWLPVLRDCSSLPMNYHTSISLSKSSFVIAERVHPQLVVINVSHRLNSPFPAEVGAMLDHRTPRNNDSLH